VVIAFAAAACTIPAAGCDLSIVAGTLEDGNAGDPALEVIVGPGEVDTTGVSIEPDAEGNAAITISLLPAAADRLAAHTAAHVGEAMSIVIDGTVVATPIINEAIQDGVVQISAAADDPAFADRFRGCLPTRIGP
jgi:preprotein translocase subunit SecD